MGDIGVHGKRKVWFSSRFLFLCLIIIYGSVFYWNFARSVIPAQTGWWQYMAWRMEEGDLPYRDFYLFVPPYFLLLTSFLFGLFGKHFMLYAIVGFFVTRVLVWVMLFRMLSAVFKPAYAAAGLMAGISVTAAYLVDQVYDYNPLLMFGVTAISYLFFRMYRSAGRRKSLFVFLVGLLCGCMVMMKQNVAVAVPPASLIGIAWIDWKNGRRLKGCAADFLLCCGGMAAAAAPGVLYLFRNHIWGDFLFCISSALDAKVANSNVLQVCWKNFFRMDELICALGIEVNYLVCRKCRAGKNLWMAVSSMALVSFLLLREFKENILGFRAGVGYGTFTKYLAFLLIAVILFRAAHELSAKKGDAVSRVFAFAMACFTLAVGWGGHRVDFRLANLLYEGVGFGNMKTKILYIGIYTVLLIWLQAACECFGRGGNKEKKEDVQRAFMPFTLCLLFVGVGFASASLEELYAVLFIPVVTAYLFHNVLEQRLVKYAGLLLCFLLCFLCMNQKRYLPYSWHGWQTSSLAEGVLPDTGIDGLEGYVLPEKDAGTYREIVSLMLHNSTKEDTVFQFSNIPLFQVLAERKSIYAAVPYFDVCPDGVAEEAAAQLREHPPKLVLFHEMEEWRWELHERVFRNGRLSGQRRILEFYQECVVPSYRLLGRFETNTGEYICLWKRTDEMTGMGEAGRIQKSQGAGRNGKTERFEKRTGRKQDT